MIAWLRRWWFGEQAAVSQEQRDLEFREWWQTQVRECHGGFDTMSGEE